MAIPDLSNVISQINEDLLKEVDSNPSIGMDTTINNPEKVFDNQSVFERLDKIRKEITSETSSTGVSYGLNSNTKEVPRVNAEIVKTEASPQQATSTQQAYANPYGYPYGSYPGSTYVYPGQQQQQQQTVKQKTKDEKVAEYADKLMESIGKQVTDKVDKQFAKVSERKSNWTIFDMHEENIKKEAKMTPKELAKQNKKQKVSDDSKISMYDTLTFVGRFALTKLLSNKNGGK